MESHSDPYHSARRLLRVIDTLGAEAANSPRDLSFLDVVAASAGLDKRSPAVLGQLQAVIELPRRVLKDLDSLPEQRDTNAARPGMSTLVNALSLNNIQKSWVEIDEEIGATGKAALTMSSLLLDRGQSEERALDEDELNRIAGEIRNFLEEVRLSTSIPQDLKIYIERALVDILHAVDDYWLKGPEALESSVDSALGRAARERRFEDRSPLLKRLGNIFTQVALVVSVANNVTSLPETADNIVHGILEIVAEPDSSAPSQPLGPLPDPQGPDRTFQTVAPDVSGRSFSAACRSTATSDANKEGVIL